MTWIRSAAATGTVVVLTVCGTTATAGHAAAEKKHHAKVIGYLYGGTRESGIGTFAIHNDASVTLVRQTPSVLGNIGGLALLHTKGGIHLYVLEGSFGGAGKIIDYAVNPKTGGIKTTSNRVQTQILGDIVGNNLYAYDGYARKHTFASALYAQKCLNAACSKSGLAVFHVRPKSGELKITGRPAASTIRSISVLDDRMFLDDALKNGGVLISPVRIKHRTGNLKSGKPHRVLADAQTPGYAGLVGALPGGVGLGNLSTGQGSQVGVAPSDGRHIGTVSAIAATVSASTLSAVRHSLLVGGTGPALQDVAPAGPATRGTIDLTQPPYNEPANSTSFPDFVETIYQLGNGVYIGTYAGLMLQGTATNKHVFGFNRKAPTVAGSLETEALAGFLR